MTDHVAVRQGDLRAHAGRVDAAAGAVGAAARSGAVTRPGPDSYGQLCTIVPILLAQLQGLVVDGIDAAADSLRDTAGRLRAAADGYGAADSRAASGVRQAGGS
jgi:hypothetical protein